MVQPALVSQADRDFNGSSLRSIAVLTLADGQVQRTLSAEALHRLTADLVSSLELYSGVQVVNAAEAERTERVLQEVAMLQQPLSVRAEELGKRLGVNGVIFGSISRYHAAEPGPYGREGDAVAFNLSLINPSTGKLEWVAKYQKDNAPLTDNLFKIGEGVSFSYPTTAELIKTGFDEAAQALEQARQTGSPQP